MMFCDICHYLIDYETDMIFELYYMIYIKTILNPAPRLQCSWQHCSQSLLVLNIFWDPESFKLLVPLIKQLIMNKFQSLWSMEVS